MEEKIIKRNYEKNFRKYLWNQYDSLHERLTRKIGSLSKILSSFNDIYHVKKEYYKSLKPLIKDEPQPLIEEENFKQTMIIVKNNNEKYIEFEDEMYSEIIEKIRSLIDKMKQEKFLYDDFKKALDYYNGEKAKMEKFKNIYHTNGKIAERSTLYYKDLQIKRKINDQNIMNQSIDKSKIDCKNRLIGLSKDCSNYIQSLKNVNKIRKEVNKKQDNLLSVYQELEWDDKNLYADVMEIIWKYQKKVYDYTGKQLNEVEIIQNAIHIDKDIRGLVEKLRKYESPEEEILYEHYPTEVDFDKCQDIKDYRVCDAIVKEMKSYVEGIFENYDEKLEDKKNRFRDLIIKFFDKNRQTTEDDKKQLLEFVEDTRTHGIFLIVLAKLRTNNRFCRDRFLIELLSDIMLKLLDNAQKINDFSIAKNCLILSQTFFFYDENDKNKKIYISNYIKKHPWLQSPRFWGDFILRQILSEFNKVEERNKGIERMIISLRKCVPENMKPRIGEVLFSQLLPYVGNMNEVEVDKKVTIKIVDSILEKFPFIEETNKVEIYKMICAAEEVPKFKEQIQNDESLKNFSLDINIVKEFNKGKKFIDADDYDDF
jgi:hypothetical protein